MGWTQIRVSKANSDSREKHFICHPLSQRGVGTVCDPSIDL
jgi:hypothetical protein